jgi:hypothetical protein
VLLIGFIIAFGYSVLLVAWPAKAREWFLRGHQIDDPVLWYKPATWLTDKPGTLVFRLFGLILFVLTLISFIFAVSENGLTWVLRQ